jgi:hypothetical protein
VDRADDEGEDGGNNGSQEVLDTIVVHVPEEANTEGNGDSLIEPLLQAASEDDAPAERLVLRSHRELSEESFGDVKNTNKSLSTSRDISEEQSSAIFPPQSAINALSKKGSRKSVNSSPAKTNGTAPSPLKHEAPAESASRTHIRFGSADPEEPTLVSALEPTPSAPEDEVSSDDDEAPETITQASAVQQTKIAEAEATKAIKEAAAASERKQEERAARRAEERKQKQRRQEQAEKKALRKARKEASKLAQIEGDLPDMLPESILAAAPEKRPATPPLDFIDTSVEDRELDQRNRHTRFLEQGEKRVKDIKRGPLHMRVLAKQNEFLAPKVDRRARNIREHWLGHRATEKKAAGRSQTKSKGKPKGRLDSLKLERKKIGGSFLRNQTEI